jgi:hypothetical protein
MLPAGGLRRRGQRRYEHTLRSAAVAARYPWLQRRPYAPLQDRQDSAVFSTCLHFDGVRSRSLDPLQITVPKMVLITDPTPCPGVPWSAEWDTLISPQPVSTQRLNAGVSSLVVVDVHQRLHAYCSAHASFSVAARADLTALLSGLVGEAAGLDLAAGEAAATGPTAAHAAAPGATGTHSAAAGKIVRQRSSGTSSSGRSSRSGRGENSHSSRTSSRGRAASRVPPLHAGARASLAASAAACSAASSPEGEEAELAVVRDGCASPSKRPRRSSAGSAAAGTAGAGAGAAGVAVAGPADPAVTSAPLPHSARIADRATSTASVVAPSSVLCPLRLNTSSKGATSTRTVASASGCGSKRTLSRALNYTGAFSDSVRAGVDAAPIASPKRGSGSGERSHVPVAPPGASGGGGASSSRAAAAAFAGPPTRAATAGVPEFRSLAGGSDEATVLSASASASATTGAAAVSPPFDMSDWLTRGAWTDLGNEEYLDADLLRLASFGVTTAPQGTRASGTLASSSGALGTSRSGDTPRSEIQLPAATSATGAGAASATNSAVRSLARHSPAPVAVIAGLSPPRLRFEAGVSPIPVSQASSRSMSAASQATSWSASSASASATTAADRGSGAGRAVGDPANSPDRQRAGAGASPPGAAAGEQPTAAAQTMGGVVATVASRRARGGFALAFPSAHGAATTGLAAGVFEGVNPSFELEAAAAAHFAAGGCTSAADARVGPAHQEAALAAGTTAPAGCGSSNVLASPPLIAAPPVQPSHHRGAGAGDRPPPQAGTALIPHATAGVANSAPAAPTSKLSQLLLPPAAEERC